MITDTKHAAITGHTSKLGNLIANYLESQNYTIIGFSRSNGYDLRDYSCVSNILGVVKQFDLFVNCAKPDYTQAQLLYRLISSGFEGKILSIGSPVVHSLPKSWTDLGLLEYATQKTALYHAHQTLSKFYKDQLLMWEPCHALNYEYVSSALKEIIFE
jgi:hypothetical protein